MIDLKETRNEGLYTCKAKGGVAEREVGEMRETLSRQQEIFVCRLCQRGG